MKTTAPSLRIGMLGFGHVASATAQALSSSTQWLAQKAARPIELSAVHTRTPSRTQGLLPKTCRLSASAQELINDPEVDVVLELMGGIEPAHQLVLQALRQGKHVVTANKALLAKHGNEIFQAAREHQRCVLFEGAVAVAIPIVKVLREATAANRITRISAILNGTCNFILSRMQGLDEEMQEALSMAQRMGYAEADPTLDISGQDAAQKLAILSALAFGCAIGTEHLTICGIEALRRQDLCRGQEHRHALKLIAHTEITTQGCMGHIGPTWVATSHRLAQVSDAMNGIALHGDLMGNAFFEGAGAGGQATSSAILADLIELARRPDMPGASPLLPTGWRTPTSPCSPLDRHAMQGLRWHADDGHWAWPYPVLLS